MTEHEDYFKCRDCEFKDHKDKYHCIADPDSRACGMFIPKKEVRLPIEEKLFNKIVSEEPITLSLKEKIILHEVLRLDLIREEQQEIRKMSKTDNNCVGE